METATVNAVLEVAEKSLTKREFLNGIVACEVIPQELRTYAENELIKMDLANERRKATSKQPKVLTSEEIEVIENIVAFLGSAKVPQVAKAIFENLVDNGFDVKIQKVTSLLTRMSNDGQVEKIEPAKRTAPLEYALSKGVE